MGKPRLDLTKAASFAAELEDDDLISRYRRRPMTLPDVITLLYNSSSDQHAGPWEHCGAISTIHAASLLPGRRCSLFCA